MHHSIGVTWPDNSQENRVINFVCYGEENGYSAMARTVGMPTAIATKLILDGTIVYDITNFGNLALLLEFYILLERLISVSVQIQTNMIVKHENDVVMNEYISQ